MMLYKLLQNIDRDFFQPTVISLISKGEVGACIEALDRPVYALGMRRGLPNPLLMLRLARRLRQLSPDVVHTWMYHADLLGGLAARLAGVPSIAWCVRNSNLDRHKTKFSTRVVLSLSALASRWIPDRIISCSEQACQIHASIGYEKKKMHVIPNGFDLNLFKPNNKARIIIRAELGISDQTPLVGLIARFDPQKNHFGFIAAAKILEKKLPGTHFVLVGNGVDEENVLLTEEIKKSGLLTNMHLLGLRKDIPELMSALDVLASSSSYGEAFPNVLGEAMACGVPCAVTDVGDSAYILGDTGRIVASGDMPALAEAIYHILSLPHIMRESLGRLARSRIEINFEIKRIVNQYETFYSSMALRRGK